MADSLVRLRIDSAEFDSKLKSASQSLTAYLDKVKKGGGDFRYLDDGVMECAKALGQLSTKTIDARGSISEMTKAFTNLSFQYRQFTDAEKSTPLGQEMKKSLDDLKGRILDSKKALADIQQELNGGTSKFGDFGKVIDTVGNRLGVSGSLTEILTSKTAMLTAGVGAGIAIVGEATKAWMSYNAELAKQDQITKVTTGLEGSDSNRMTDAARAMADVYKVDFRQAIDAANTLMTQFGKTGDEAIQLLRDGMQGMVMGDGQKLLNMIKQYAPAFRDAGISASQLVAIIQNSEGGIFTDQNMNAIVMGIKNIRLMTTQTSEALAKLGIDGQDMTKKLNDGTMTIFDALKQVMGALQNVGSGSQAAGEVMQTVFGRQGVSAGTNLAKAIESLNTNLQETKRQTGEVGEAYDDLLRSTEKLNTAIREAFGYNGWEEMATGIKSKLITALADVLTLLNKIRDYDMPDWLKGPGDKPKPYSGTKVDTDYITRGTSQAEREKRYTTVTGNINKKLQNLNAQEAALGKPYTYTDKNGGLVEQIDTPEEVAQKRRQIQSSRQILTRRLNTIQSQHDTLTAEPVRANTTPPKTGGNSGGTGGGRSLSAPEQADAKYVQAQKDYEQSLQQAALEVKAGTINSAEAKKKELQAAETLWKSIGDAREVYDSPKLKEAQANVEAKIVALGPEVEKAIEAQKAVEKASRELEMANKKAADARAKLADAETTGELKKILPAQKAVTEANREVTRKETVLHELQEKTIKVNVEQGSVNLPKVPTDDETIKVNVEQGSVNLPKVPTDDETIKVNVEQGSVNLPKVPTDDETIKVNVEQGSVNLPKVPTDDETIKVNVEQGSVNFPKVPTDEETIKVNVEQGNINLPKVPTDDETIKVNVEQGSVNLPEIPTDDETIKVNAETGDVSLPEIPDEKTIKVDAVPGDVKLPEVKEEIQIPVTLSNLDALKQKMTEEMATTPVGDSILQNMQEAFSDASAIGAIFSTAVKNGIDTATFDTSGIMQKLLNREDISDETIQENVDKLNALLKAKFDETEWPKVAITFDVKTKEITTVAHQQQQEAQKMAKDWQAAGSAIQQVGAAMNAIQDPAAKVMGTIAQAIGSVALGAGQAIANASSMGPWAWIAFAAAATATMITTINSIHSATGYAEGGIVDGSKGGFVQGNTYSGDQVGNVRLNAGELVLNKSQQNNLANALEGGGLESMSLSTVITAEDIKLILNNNGERIGVGEYFES